MCGIVGCNGLHEIARDLFECLRKLEYRGYDSAGMATEAKSRIIIKKDVGKIDEINSRYNLIGMPMHTLRVVAV